MNRAAAIALGVVALAVAAIAAVFYALRGPQKPVLNTASAGVKVSMKGCTPEMVEEGFDQALAAGQAGGQAGIYGAAAGVAASALDTLSGPCGAKIEKKLREALEKGVAGAAEALRKFDAQARSTADKVALGPQRRAVGRKVKKLGSKAKKGLKKLGRLGR